MLINLTFVAGVADTVFDQPYSYGINSIRFGLVFVSYRIVSGEIRKPCNTISLRSTYFRIANEVSE